VKEVSGYNTAFSVMLSCLAGNFVIQVATGNLKSSLGSKVKSELRSKLFSKLLRLGTSETATASTAGLTQLASEGIEQLELYFSVYLPQFFYALTAPLLLFAVYLTIDFRTALVLLICVPLIPLSIIAVSKYAKKVFAKYWGQIKPKWGENKIDSMTEIRAENISFSYDKQMPVLRYADMSFKRGELTAIVGKSGSGKSTITKLLMGMISPDNGQIKCICDNKSYEIHRLSREYYYSKIGVVRANTYLFNLSVFENFRLVNPQVTHEEIWTALDKVNMSDFIKQNGGLHKPLDEDASNISGGQKQRIALAIALTTPKDIYIFDEVTSNIDSDSEKIIMNNIYKLKADAAVILTAGLLRGGLRYLEQYANHYIAFKLLAVFRDKVFGALRRLAPAKLECKRKGEIISTLTADIETLEVFYAHTLSPVCIAIFVSLCVTVLTAFICNLQIAVCALLSFITIGVIHPIISNKFLKESGVIYRSNFSDLNAFFLDSVKGIREIVQSNAGASRSAEINEKTAVLSACTKNLNKKTAIAGAISQALIAFSMIAVLTVGLIQFENGAVEFGDLLIGYVLVISSFGPVIALSALPGTLTQTFASGDRVLNLLNENPSVNDITNGKDFIFENLSIEDLSFGYDDKIVIENFNLSVKKGEIVGLKGVSGRGMKLSSVISAIVSRPEKVSV
jgi:ABC-type transport system involved in cytochrome bd biosynthesis fused ATPase/permease subunit